jgi:membrane-associated protease RseP (regulator of RpoE activity)
MKAEREQALREAVSRIRSLVEDLLDLDAVYSTTRSVVMRGRPRVPVMDFQTAASGRLAAAGYDYNIEVTHPPGLFGERVLLSVQLEKVRQSVVPWLNIGLFFVTFLTMSFNYPQTLPVWFTVWFLLILLFHEFGHYFAAKHHGMDTSWPYFIPAPFFFFGTLGAVIRVRSPFRDRVALFDMAVAGPIAGFVVSVIALVVGLSLSTATAAVNAQDGYMLGESLLFNLLEPVLVPGWQAGYTTLIHPIGFAGWAGLLVTMLNMLPMGQLDGGHIAYAMFGRAQKLLGVITLVGLAVAAFWWPGWLLWVGIGLYMRVKHPPTLIDEIELSGPRRMIGWLAFVILALCFIPVPISL